MPLPFAPKPAESKVYQSLKGELVSEVTADQFDSLKATVYAQGVDGAEDEYRRLLLLGLAADRVSVSGPVAGTQVVQNAAVTSTSATEVFQPGAGEVWQLVNASSVANQAPSDDVDFYLYYVCDDQNGVSRTVYGGSDSSGSTSPNLEQLFEKKTAQIVDENTSVQIQVNNMRGVTTFNISFLAIRLR